MRAAHYDLFVETGSDFYRVVQLWGPTGVPVTASSVVIGDRVYVDGLPLLVADIQTFRASDGNLWVELIMGRGLWDDPHVRVLADEKMMPAVMLDIEAASAAFSLNGQRREIPTSITDNTVVMLMDSATTGQLAYSIGACSWDLFASIKDMGRQRVLEGTLTVQRGESA